MKELHIKNDSHLGDTLLALIICFNHLDDFEKINVYGPNFIKDIINNFDFLNFEYFGKTTFKNFKYNISNFFNVNKKTCGFNYIFFYFNLKNKIFEKIKLPKLKNFFKNEKNQYFQFDTRSVRVNKPAIPKKTVEKIIKKNLDKDYPIYGIGGLDTLKEYNYEYHLGNINFIIDKFKNCKKFIGCDSGMFVLSAMCNVNCEIFILNNNKNCIEQNKSIYEKIFPNCKYNTHPFKEEIIKLI